MWLGISNYDPTFSTDREQFIHQHKPLLRSLIGQQFIDLWLLWDVAEDEWYSDAPVVLRTKQMQVELCANQLNEFAITTNTINLTSAVSSVDMEDGETKQYAWRKLEDESRLLQSRISRVEVMELQFDSRIGSGQQEWLLNGVCFNLEEGCLSVFNGMDTNGLTFDKEINDSIRYIQI